ncbi:MAG: RNA-directed DNA polymerase, partial [Propionibacteriaceae bacterium]
MSIIVRVLKPFKDSFLPKNYRPIALTSCVSKIYERMVNARLVWYLDSKNLVSNRQFGFRKNRSTSDPLMFLTREIQNAFAVQNQTVAVFFDLEKAYDTTWRGGILLQLVEWGVVGNLFYCLKDFLSERYLKVRVGSYISSAFPQEEGLPQGSVLSPTLFNVAVNGLLEQVPVGVHGLAFADDYAIICSKSTAVEACQKIQTAINASTLWASAKGFKFSPEKTKAIRFCRLRRVEEIPTLFLNDSILPYEDSIKYLGVTFDKKLTFTQHVNEVVCNVKLRLNILKVVSNFNWGADRITLLRMYQVLCLSKIDYGCQVYGCACKTTLQKLDVVHNMALRICTGAYR